MKNCICAEVPSVRIALKGFTAEDAEDTEQANCSLWTTGTNRY
jgi:hypothetical protein